MNTNLEYLFHIIMSSSRQLRKDNPNADGLNFWKPIKKILAKYDKISSLKSWKKNGISKKTIDNIMKLEEKIIDGYGNVKIIEHNHFIIQTVRIPIKDEVPNLRKIIQLALNIGQYIGIGRPKESWMDLNRYILKKDNINISSLIEKDMVTEIIDVIILSVPKMNCLRESLLFQFK